MTVEDILIIASAAVTFVKVLIDLLKLAWATPQWVPPVLAVILGPVVVALLFVAGGQGIDAQLGAVAILAGWLTAGSAVGVTELQKRTRMGIAPHDLIEIGPGQISFTETGEQRDGNTNA